MNQTKVYSYQGIEMIHIAEFAKLTNRSIPSTRHLIEQGNSIRKMKFFRDRSRIMIPVAELTGYPLKSGQSIFHYVKQADGSYKKEFCTTCSFSTEFCEARKVAEELVVPKGDD